MVQSINVTLDDFSPVIQYSPAGAWGDGPTTDPLWQEYSNNGTFTLASAAGASATFTFNGTGVWVYGAMRSNHGQYNVTFDGVLYQDNGYSSADLFQQVLFAAVGLDGTVQHTVSIINSPTDAVRRFLDIDFIVYQTQIPDGEQEVKQQDTASNFHYSSSGWDTNPANLSSFDGGSGHTTTLGGAYVDLSFEGSNVELYGTVGPSNGAFTVQLDGGSPTTLNASRTRFSPQEILFQASGLGSGNHTMRVTNGPFSGQTLSIDYATLGQSANMMSMSGSPSDEPTVQRSTSLSGGAIGGIVAGGSSFVLVLIILLLFWFRRRRRKQSGHSQEMLQAEFAIDDDNASALDSSSHLTPFRVFNSVISRQPVDPLPLPPSSPSVLQYAQESPAQTDFSLSQPPRLPEPGPSSGPRLIVYNADGAVVESASLADIIEEKKRLAMRERERYIEGRLLDPGPVSRLASRIRNSAGQLPPDYHLATQPSPSRNNLQ